MRSLRDVRRERARGAASRPESGERFQLSRLSDNERMDDMSPALAFEA